MTKPYDPPQSSDHLTLRTTGRHRDLTGLTLGDFRIERLLGHGGMGEVYLARQVSLDRQVALKVLRPELVSNPTSLARFESEAWAAARLNHPNIAHIYSLGEIDGIRFIAMEYVQGTNLRDYLTKKGIPELPLALSIMRQATQAVGAAGETGLVHRDIKPDNLLLTRKGQVKVADFGLVLAPAGERVNLTQTGMTLGTPLYMSPEQVQGHAVDHRSDLYSLGVTFYHMLAGSPPFRAETGLAVALKHVRETPVSLAVHRPDLPPGLVKLVMRLIDKDPDRRYQSAAELLRDLARVRGAVQMASPPATSPATAGAEPPVPTEAGGTPRRGLALGVTIGPGLIAGLAVAGLFAGGLLGWLARSPDLLSDGAPAPKGPPGLWLADWREIDNKGAARAQYRFAQTGAAGPEQLAAWVAVPGYFPRERDVASRAFVQIARQLFREGDADRLEAFAGDLKRSGRDYDRLIAQAAEVGVAALRDDPQELTGRFNTMPSKTLDEPLAELCLEAVARARRSPKAGGYAGSLGKLRKELLGGLKLEPLGSPDASNP